MRTVESDYYGKNHYEITVKLFIESHSEFILKSIKRIFEYD